MTTCRKWLLAVPRNSATWRPTVTSHVVLNRISAALFTLVMACAVLTKTTPSLTRSYWAYSRSALVIMPCRLSTFWMVALKIWLSDIRMSSSMLLR